MEIYDSHRLDYKLAIRNYDELPWLDVRGPAGLADTRAEKIK